MRWLICLILLLPLAAQATELDGRKEIQFDLACGARKAKVEWSVPPGTPLNIKLRRPQKCGSDGAVSNASNDATGSSGSPLLASDGAGAAPVSFRPAIRVGFGAGSQGIALIANTELAVGLTKSVELIGQADAGLAENRYISTGFSAGIGGWLNDQVRFSGFIGGATVRTSSWNFESAGPYGALQGDFISAGRKSGGMNIALRVTAGPAWSADSVQIGQWGASFLVGWMAGR